MRTRDIVITFIVLVTLVGGVLLIFRAKSKKMVGSPTPTPNIFQKVNETFPGLNIPEGVERANLSDVTGGNSIGVATRTEIVANLPELAKGQVYQGWAENSSGKTVLLGNFRVSKGGWILNYDSSKYSGYNKVIVSVGTKHVLEGSF